MSDLATLLPSNSTAVERNLEQVVSRPLAADLQSLWNPVSCPAALLPWLAWALSVDNWDASWTEIRKREVVAASAQIHRMKGTIGAVTNALAALDRAISLSEWQDYGGEPYHFRAGMDITGSPVTAAELTSVFASITAAKNARSILEKLTLTLQQTGVMYHAGGIFIAMTVTAQNAPDATLPGRVKLPTGFGGAQFLLFNGPNGAPVPVVFYSGAWRDSSGNEVQPGEQNLQLGFTDGLALLNGQLVDPASALSTTRASTGTATRLDGSVQTFAANTPRTTDKGLLVEAARTNLYVNSRGDGAVLGVLGAGGAIPTGWQVVTNPGLSVEVLEILTGEVGGIEVQISGVPESTGWFRLRTVANSVNVAGAAVISGHQHAVISGGSIDNLTNVYIQLVNAPINVDLPFSNTNLENHKLEMNNLVPGQFVVNNEFRMWVNTAAQPVDITIKIGGAQLELGSLTTSHIPTTTTAVARAADDIAFANLDWMSSTGTLLIEAQTSTDWTTKPGNNYLLGGGSSERFVYGKAGNGNLFGFDGVNSIVHGAVGDDALFKLAIGYSPATGMSSSLNGAPVVSSSVIIPKPSLLWLGRRWDGAFHWNAAIKSVANLPTRVSNSELESLSGGA